MELKNQPPNVETTYFISEGDAYVLVDEILKYGITLDDVAYHIHKTYQAYDIMIVELEAEDDGSIVKGVCIKGDEDYPFPPDMIAVISGVFQELVAGRFSGMN